MFREMFTETKNGNEEIVLTLTNKEEVKAVQDMLKGTNVDMQVDKISDDLFNVEIFFKQDNINLYKPFTKKIKKAGYEAEYHHH